MIRSAAGSGAALAAAARQRVTAATHRRISTVHLVADRYIERLRGAVVQSHHELRAAGCEAAVDAFQLERALHAREDVAAGFARRDLRAGGGDERELARLYVGAAPRAQRHVRGAAPRR